MKVLNFEECVGSTSSTQSASKLAFCSSKLLFTSFFETFRCQLWISILLFTWASSAVCLWISVLFFLLPVLFFYVNNFFHFLYLNFHTDFWSPSAQKKERRKRVRPRERKPRSVSPQWDHVNNCVILAKLLRREFMGSTRVSALRIKRMNSPSRSVTRFRVYISAEWGPGTFLGLAVHKAKLTAQSHRPVVLVIAS